MDRNDVLVVGAKAVTAEMNASEMMRMIPIYLCNFNHDLSPLIDGCCVLFLTIFISQLSQNTYVSSLSWYVSERKSHTSSSWSSHFGVVSCAKVVTECRSSTADKQGDSPVAQLRSNPGNPRKRYSQSLLVMLEFSSFGAPHFRSIPVLSEQI